MWWLLSPLPTGSGDRMTNTPQRAGMGQQGESGGWLRTTMGCVFSYYFFVLLMTNYNRLCVQAVYMTWICLILSTNGRGWDGRSQWTTTVLTQTCLSPSRYVFTHYFVLLMIQAVTIRVSTGRSGLALAQFCWPSSQKTTISFTLCKKMIHLTIFKLTPYYQKQCPSPPWLCCI